MTRVIYAMAEILNGRTTDKFITAQDIFRREILTYI